MNRPRKIRTLEDNSNIPEIPDYIIDELARHVKTPDDLNRLSRHLLKLTVEKALSAELTKHLGYSKNTITGRDTGNSRNGFGIKTLKTTDGEIVIDTPRDRTGTFEPLLVRKGQTRFTAMDDQILALYARGMSTRDIVDMFQQLYGVEVSAALVSKVTNAVLEEVKAWQDRPLDEVYPIVYLDCLRVKVQQDGKVIDKSVYLALGINMDGHKELLGLWMTENEGAKFWMNVLTQLHNRGLKDIFIACVDGLKGFPDAIKAVYPQTHIQLCIVHQVRHSLRYVPDKDRKAVAAALKSIYQSVTVQAAQIQLDEFAARWDDQYPSISRSWRNNWENLITLFDYPDDIRRAIYTTNAIESLNSVLRKSIKTRKLFPTDDSVYKLIYLVIQQASRRWTMPIHHWKQALNRFSIDFPERMPKFN